MALRANEYRAEHAKTTSTGLLLSAELPFTANYIRVVNDGTVPLRVTFDSTAASTVDAELKPGEVIVWAGAATGGMGVLTTSTSTDGTDHRRFRVLALGG